MIKLLEIIQEYEEKKITLEELQELVWGLSEIFLDGTTEEKLHFYLTKTNM